MSDAVRHFSQSYAEARGRFLAAIATHGIPVTQHVHPSERGRDGEPLSMDCALVGPQAARRLLVLTSATHGVEGFCGSGAQVALLRDAAFMTRLATSGVSLLFVHAVNPYGFSHWRRTNEDNIDLNRNFLDHAKGHPPATAYAEVHALLLPGVWPPDADNVAAVERFVAERGLPAFQQAISGGQYQFPDGLFFGGNAPSWSNRTLRSVLRGYAGRAERLMWIDFHTGLGPYGHGEMIQAGGDDDAELARAKAVWGDQVTSVYKGSSTSARLDGLMAFAVYDELPGAEYAGIALEYGTLPMLEVIMALRGDHWLRLHPEAPPALRDQIKRQIRDAFYCDADDWKRMVVEQARSRTLQAIDALALSLTARGKGVLLMLVAGLFWSTSGVFVRNIVMTDAWEIVFWRSLFMVVFLVGILGWWHRGATWSRIVAVGAPGVLSGALLAATFFFFILAITRNTVANTFALMSTGPFFVAVMGLVFLGEKVPARTWAAIAAALGGVTLMFVEGLDAGRSVGNLLALGVPTAFALNVVILRKMHASVDMVPAVLIAGLISVAVALPFAWPLAPAPRDLALLAPMGMLQLGLGCVLMTRATRYLSAGEVGLLCLLETILAPLWVWIGMGERPSALALAGALVVLGALVVNEWVGMRRVQPA